MAGFGGCVICFVDGVLQFFEKINFYHRYLLISAKSLKSSDWLKIALGELLVYVFGISGNSKIVDCQSKCPDVKVSQPKPKKAERRVEVSVTKWRIFFCFNTLDAMSL